MLLYETDWGKKYSMLIISIYFFARVKFFLFFFLNVYGDLKLSSQFRVLNLLNAELGLIHLKRGLGGGMRSIERHST